MTRCGTCGTTWQGLKIAHCRACHKTFTTPSNFDTHWRGRGENRVCVDPATVGLVPVQRLGYVVWATAADERQTARWDAFHEVAEGQPS